MSTNYLIKLSTLINDMNSFQTMLTVDEPTKVRRIDMVLRDESVDYKLPFRRRQGSLRVFQDVVIYPAPSDYDELSFVDNNAEKYSERARFRYSSFDQFLQDIDNRNDLCEITDGENVFIGCRYQTKNAQSIKIDPAEAVVNYSCTGDASSPTLDNVFYKDGNASIRFTISNSSGSAAIINTFNRISNSLYRRSYVFRLVYLGGATAPTSIKLRFGNDDSANYLESAALTTQFSGQALEAGDWNLLAFDLNTATVVGTIDSANFDTESIHFTGAPSGTYYVDSSYMRAWELLSDFWYYSINAVKTELGVYKQTFIDPDAETYDVTDYLIGTREFANFIVLRATQLGAIDKGDTPLNENLGPEIKALSNNIPKRFEMVKPLITNMNYRFANNPLSRYGGSFLNRD